MDCPLQSNNGFELILEYGANKLSPEAASDFELHLAECASCRDAAQSQRALWLALDEWKPQRISSDFDARLIQRIAAEEQGWWGRLHFANWSWRPAMPVVAACVVLIAAFLIKGPIWERPTSARVEPEVRIEQVQHALDDMEMLKQVGVYSQDTPASQKL